MNLLPVQTSSSSMSLLPTSSTHSFLLPSSIYHNPTSLVLNILLSLPLPCPLSYSSLSIYLQTPVTCPYFLLPSISPNPSLPFPLSTSLYVYPFTPLLSIVTHVSFHLPNPFISVPSFLLPLTSPLPFTPCLTFPNMYPPLPSFYFFPTFSHCCPLPERRHE